LDEVGAVKLARGPSAPESSSSGPSLTVQDQLLMLPSGSLLPLPSRSTRSPPTTAWSGPASALGARLTGSGAGDGAGAEFAVSAP